MNDGAAKEAPVPLKKAPVVDERCMNCRAFRTRFKNPMNPTDDVGNCHRYPTVVAVNPYHWCSEWTAAPAKPKG